MSLILNCVCRKVPSSAFPSLRRRCRAICEDALAYGPSFVRHLTQCEGFYLKCQPMWQMMYVFPQPRDYQRRAVLQCSSPHQFHKLHSEVREAFAARWLLTCSKKIAFQCEYLTGAAEKIRVML